MSHGVNRAVLKEGKTDNRVIFLKKLINKLNGIKYKRSSFDDDLSRALNNAIKVT